MKKLVMLFSIVALVMIALAPATGSVSAQKFPGYVTGTQVMNLNSAQATITLEYYNADDGSANAGKLMDSASDTIDGNKSKTYFPTLTSFKGSMVVSSSQPLGAVTNLQNSAKTAGASYVGASKGANIVQIPLLMKGNGTVPYDTWYSIQNAGSADATVTVTYSDCPSSSQVVVKANASKILYQATESCHTKKVFSAQLSSPSQPIVVVVVEENVSKIFAYNGFPGDSGDISTELVMPLVNENNNGTTTGIQIQNTGSTPTDVTVSYTPLVGTACTETQNIPGNSSTTFALIAFSSNNANPAITTDCKYEKFVGSARVSANTGNAPLVGIVNQSKSIMGEAYGAFNPNLATAKVVMPLLMDRNGSTNWSTGFSVMNAGGASTWVKCTVTNNAYTVEGEVQPGASLTQLQGGAIAAGYVGSGTCIAYTSSAYSTVDTGAKLVAVVNETGTPNSDHLLVYEGINVAP